MNQLSKVLLVLKAFNNGITSNILRYCQVSYKVDFESDEDSSKCDEIQKVVVYESAHLWKFCSCYAHNGGIRRLGHLFFVASLREEEKQFKLSYSQLQEEFLPLACNRPD